MGLSVVASDGSKTPPYFFNANVKVNTFVYNMVLRYHVLAWLKSAFPRENFVFTQDWAHVLEGAAFQEGEHGYLLAFILT
uniref:Putative LOC100197594 [Hydra vulgaris] n=1 Tax=Lepeophtheirus salmonis TaxID=72036 RepID=A0A0K2UC23_LEPSM